MPLPVPIPPLEVSRAIVVVITRVRWSILPPTIITAPTSDTARPNPASTTVSSEYRASMIIGEQRPPRRHSKRGEKIAVISVQVL